jgi:hypothetical protein
MVLAFGEVRLEILILVNGKMAKLMDMESILGLMVIGTKANLKIA